MKQAQIILLSNEDIRAMRDGNTLGISTPRGEIRLGYERQRQHNDKHKIKWHSDKVKSNVLEFIKNGATPAEASRHFNINYKTVYSWLQKTKKAKA